MLRPRPSPLWLRLAWPVVLFVAAGSIALVLWLHASARGESRAVFARLAQTNADFIRSARLPANERVAESIGRVLNMRVFFRHGSWEMAAGSGNAMSFRQGLELVPPPEADLADHAALLRELTPREGIARAGAAFEAIAVGVNDQTALLVVRRVEPPLAFLTRPRTLLVLGAFWALSFGLAWALTRSLVRPLRLIAERLPHIEDDSERTLPGAERPDEIGQLARAYLATRAQLAAERDRREKSERLALLGRMATGLAHEIHNPLAAIRMHAQLVDSAPDSELAAAARESLPVLLGETAKIEGLVNQWMFLARPAPPQTAPADLADLVRGVVRALQPEAAHARVTLTDRTTPGFLVNVDARRITQAIGNVLRNAIQAMPGGGEVTIETAMLDADCSTLDEETPGVRAPRFSIIQLVFRDTGPGFSAAALAHHTELFYSEKEGGMGIGLSVTAEILRAHRGALRVANAEGGGAVVEFLLPPEKSEARNPKQIPMK